MKMENHILNTNTILHTKDGSKIGNAIVTGREGFYWEITTDYGNKVKLTSEEIDEYFNIAWSNMSKEIDGFSCKEIQEMMSDTHKHRVPNFEIMEKNKTVYEVIEDIQIAHIQAGGKFLKQSEIRKMTVEELLNLLIPNNVSFTIKFKL